eukprot:393094-Rhodomonas_salina.1
MRGSVQTERLMSFIHFVEIKWKGWSKLTVGSPNSFVVDPSWKDFFELHVNSKFDESLLAACFVSVGTDKNLRSAQLEWLDDEKLLVKCDKSIRQNTLVKALQTPEARSIVTVHNIIAADWDNRQGFKEYREAGGRVITPEAYALLEDKLEQQKQQNTRLSAEAHDAHTEVQRLMAASAVLEETIRVERLELTSEKECFKATITTVMQAAVGSKRVRDFDTDALALQLQQNLHEQVEHLRQQLTDASLRESTVQQLLRDTSLRESTLQQQLLREQAFTDEARAALAREQASTAEARVQLREALVLATKSSASASEERTKTEMFKKQRDLASNRQRTASKLVSKFVTAIQTNNTVLMQSAVRLAHD